MATDMRFQELVIGIQGLALLRSAVTGDSDFRRARMEEIRSLANPGDDRWPAAEQDIPEVGLDDAYASWAGVYDSEPNGLIEVEEPLVHALIEHAPRGRALDAACGTGRHTAALVQSGYASIGVDQSPAMLAVAREKVPSGEYRVGTLERLPLDGDSVDLAVCAVALCHLPDMTKAVGELARVVRPGGRVIISDIHPMVALLQRKLIVEFTPNRLGFMSYHVHLPSRFLEVFATCGLRVRSCQEPLFNGRLPPGGYEESVADAARAAWDGIPSAIVWELDVAP